MTEGLLRYTAPYHVVEIGGRRIERGVERLVAVSSRLTPADRCEIDLANVDGELSGLCSQGDVVTVRWGYRGGDEAPIFVGTARQVISGERLHIEAVDRMQSLFETRVTQSFINESPGAIIRWALRRVGITGMRVHEEAVVFPRFNIFNRTVSQVIEMVNNTLLTAYACAAAVDYRWFFDPDGVFHYGPYHEIDNGRNPFTGTMPVFAYQDNLIDLEPALTADGLSRLETVAVPGLRHSMPIKVVEPIHGGINGEYRVERVEYHQCPRRMRSHVWFRPTA